MEGRILLEKLTRVPSSQGPFGLSVLHLGTCRHLSRSCGWLFVCTLSPFLHFLPSLPIPLFRNLEGSVLALGGLQLLNGRRQSQSLQLHSHCSRRDGDSRKVRFRTPAHRAVPFILAKCLWLYASYHHAGHLKEFPRVENCPCQLYGVGDIFA